MRQLALFRAGDKRRLEDARDLGARLFVCRFAAQLSRKAIPYRVGVAIGPSCDDAHDDKLREGLAPHYRAAQISRQAARWFGVLTSVARASAIAQLTMSRKYPHCIKSRSLA